MSFLSRLSRFRTVASSTHLLHRAPLAFQATRNVGARFPEDPDINPITGNKISSDADPKNLGAFVKPYFNQPVAVENELGQPQQQTVSAKPPDVEEQRMSMSRAAPSGPTGEAPYMGGPPRAQQPHQTDTSSSQGKVEVAGTDGSRGGKRVSPTVAGAAGKHRQPRTAAGTSAMAGSVATGMAAGGADSPPSVNTGTSMDGHTYSVEELEKGTEPADTPFAPVE